jgi:hypothetical protein
MCHRFHRYWRAVLLLGLLALALAGPAAAMVAILTRQGIPVQQAFPNANLSLLGEALAQVLLVALPSDPCVDVGTQVSFQQVGATERLPDGRIIRYQAAGVLQHRELEVLPGESFTFEEELRYVALGSHRAFHLPVLVTVQIQKDGSAQVTVAFPGQPCV